MGADCLALLEQARDALGRRDADAAVTAAAAAVTAASPGRQRVVARRTLGEALLLDGDRYAARAAYVAALDEAADALPPGDVEVLLLHNGIGVTAKFTGEVELAEHHYGVALALLEARGGDDQLLAGLHHNLGGLAHTRGDMAAAAHHTELALEGHDGVDAVGAAADRGQLGSIYSEQGRHDEAIELLCRAAKEMGDLLGAEHLEVAIARTTLGAALHRAGRLDEAADAYAEGLAAREAALGTDHPELAPTLLNLGQLAADRGDDAGARAHASRAVAVLEGNVVEDHPFLVVARARAAG